MINHTFLRIDPAYIELLERQLENSQFPILEQYNPHKRDTAILLQEVKRLEHLLERLADQYLTEKWELIDEVHQLKSIIAKLQTNGTATRRIIKSKSIDNRHESTQP